MRPVQQTSNISRARLGAAMLALIVAFAQAVSL
jgi:hypothetical protein